MSLIPASPVIDSEVAQTRGARRAYCLLLILLDFSDEPVRPNLGLSHFCCLRLYVLPRQKKGIVTRVCLGQFALGFGFWDYRGQDLPRSKLLELLLTKSFVDSSDMVRGTWDFRGFGGRDDRCNNLQFTIYNFQ